MENQAEKFDCIIGKQRKLVNRAQACYNVRCLILLCGSFQNFAALRHSNFAGGELTGTDGRLIIIGEEETICL